MNEPPLEIPPTSPLPESEPEFAPTQPKRSWVRYLSALWTLIFRLTLLGVGMGTGWIVGLLAAQFWPQSRPAPPFQEIVQRRASHTLYKLQQLPSWWRGDHLEPAPILPAATSVEVAPNDSLPTLTDAEQQLLASELDALEADVDAFNNRLADLEQQLGRQPSTAPPEARLQRLNQVLLGESTLPVPASTPSPPPIASEPPDTPPNTLPGLARDRVTLPSQLLFAPGDSELLVSGEQLLETILPDLSRYPNAAIVVGSHVEAVEDAATSRELSFNQAVAVQLYLASRLGEGYHWVAVGYGQTQPLGAGNPQRNNRIEMAIVPVR